MIFPQKIMCSTGKTSIFFLGQAGFIIKSRKGTLIGIDMYLSDCVERMDGFKRLMPKILEPDDIIFDAVVTTHFHFDHYDIDSIPVLMSNGKTTLISAYDCRHYIETAKIPNERVKYMKQGDDINIEDISIKGMPCDHGESAPEAIGLMISVDGKKIYITGDTCLHKEEIERVTDHEKIDVAISPINGAFGNMNEHDAVEMCKILKPQLYIPCHYWNFAEHGGSPGLMKTYFEKEFPEQKFDIMCMGEQVNI